MASASQPKAVEEKKSRAPRRKSDGARQLTPLWIISLFVSLTETALGFVAYRSTGLVQFALTAFVIVFPVLIAAMFFAVLWFRPHVFYPPREFEKVDVERYVTAFSNARFTQAVRKTGDLQGQIAVIGNPDQFKLLFKAGNKDWKKSTKAMEVEGGCIIQVTTEQLNPDGSLTAAEAVAFVPGVAIQDDPVGEGRHLCPRRPAN